MRIMLVLPLFYLNYAQNLILFHIALIFPRPANYAENYASLIRQSLSECYPLYTVFHLHVTKIDQCANFFFSIIEWRHKPFGSSALLAYFAILSQACFRNMGRW